MPELTNSEELWLYALGRKVRITALFAGPTADDDANAYMSRPGNTDAVIACVQGVVFLADKHDSGTREPPTKAQQERSDNEYRRKLNEDQRRRQENPKPDTRPIDDGGIWRIV